MTSPDQAEPNRLAEVLETEGRFFFCPRDLEGHRPLLAAFDNGSDWTADRLGELAAGRLRLFSGEPRETGWPPRWHTNVITGQEIANDLHFSRIPEYDHGDVKVVWEPNRFTFAFDLVRIYWRTGEECCPAMFWEAVEDWRRCNPPNTGVNWKCGQESSLRAFAWCFGLWGFLHSAETTPARIAMLVTMLAITAKRVEADIGYGLSQKNNHGISEAAGLLTIGLLLPMLRDSVRWERSGRDLLEKQARELIYDDGGFSQYSANYHRVMLDDYVWAIRLARLAGRPLSRELVGRVAGAGRFLGDIQDSTTGGVPRYGHDDGACVLPLSCCSYDDYRPAVQATAALEDEHPLAYGPGPWNEQLLWLFGPEALHRACVPTTAGDTWKDGGYGTLRRGDDFAFVRGGHFRHRPSQADLLHVDVWWRGRNVALDPGTFSYNATGPWASIPFGGTACHNTVTVDGVDQAERVSRFLYLPWPAARRHRQVRSRTDRLGLLELEHDGYRRLPDPVSHRRALVQLGDEHWLVADVLDAAAEHEYRLHWLLVDAPKTFDGPCGRLTLTIDDATYGIQVLAVAPVEISVVRGEDGGPRGWYSRRYQQLAPAISLAASVRARRFRFFSVLGPGDWQASLEADHLRVVGPHWEAKARLRPADAGDLLERITWRGELRDEIEPA